MYVYAYMYAQVRCCAEEREHIDDAEVKKNEYWTDPAIKPIM
jgi:hypothetical protein